MAPFLFFKTKFLRKVIEVDQKNDIVLPSLQVEGESIPEALEKALFVCWEEGTRIPTEHDREEDPNSRDSYMTMTVRDVLSNRMIHLPSLPGGLYDLVKYVAEAADGLHDHWINPDEGKWQYTYHERIEQYTYPSIDEPINQLDFVVNKLAQAPYTRRAQVSIWKAWEDPNFDDPACLQRLWFRVFEDQLVMAVHMRSNDAFKAAFMNMFAFAEIQRKVARDLTEKLDREITPTVYIHQADSFHIYGSYFEELEGFLDSLENRPNIEDRTWTAEQAEDHYNLARGELLEKLDEEIDVLEDQDPLKKKLQGIRERMVERYKADGRIRWEE